MITFLTTFKPFAGDDAWRQRNALLSWLALGDDIEVIVFGRAEGLEPVVRELGLVYYPEVACIDGRLPRIDSMFAIAQRKGRHDLQSFVNGDIILGPDFPAALRSIPFPRFLMVGATWRAEIWAEASVRLPEQLPQFRKQALSCGGLVDTGIDFFAYRRDSLAGLPPLAVGAVTWDNYMIEHCRRRAIPVIDATHDVLALHQQHDYVRTAGGSRITEESGAADHNRRIVGAGRRFTVKDASHVLVGGVLQPYWASLPHLRYRWSVSRVRRFVRPAGERVITWLVRPLCRARDETVPYQHLHQDAEPQADFSRIGPR